ncbi:hypothetical protein VSR68_22490 [Paraburkholderia phymatum]|uniref:hypothetical protein n=1 Tax=Paraburkholderia phymatum TaxID=148447 RepID=UPI003171C832
MNRYMIIFRTTRDLTPEEVARRSAEMIQQRIAAARKSGVAIDPRPPGRTIATVGVTDHDAAAPVPVDPSLAMNMYLDAGSADEVLEQAWAYPSLHYGTTLELRARAPATSVTVDA